MYSEEFIFHGIILEKSDLNKLVVEKREMLPKNLQILFANKINGKITSISFDQNSKIFDMKNAIERKTSLEFDEFYLEFQGEHLNDDKTMNYYKIVDKSMINIIGALKGGKKIQVKTVNEDLFDIEVSDSDDVLNLKSKIKTKINISENEQELYFGNIKLEDSVIIKNLQIKEGSIVRCEYKHVDISIIVEFFEATYNLNVKKYNKITDIKTKFKEKTNIDINDHNILFKVTPLVNNQTLDSYGIVNGSKLLVIANVPGGEYQKKW